MGRQMIKQSKMRKTHIIYRLKAQSEERTTDAEQSEWKGSLRGWGTSTQMSRFTFQGTITPLETQGRK